MEAIKLDPAFLKPILLRIGRNASFTMEFLLAGNPYPIDTFDFEFYLKKKTALDSEDKIMPLAIGDGLTITGASLNKLKFDISEEKSSTLQPVEYFAQLVNKTTVQTWYNGPLKSHLGEFSGSEVDDMTVNLDLGDKVIQVNITLPHLTDLTPTELQQLAQSLAPYFLG